MTSAQTHFERILDTGLRNAWHPVLPGWRVNDAPVGITRLGENIVVWRDKDGTVRALEDRCPHRGARLSMGWNLGDRVACWYHGVEVDGRGAVVNVPAVDNCPMERDCKVRSYPAQEANGAIFLYFGDVLHPEPPKLDLPEQLTDDANWGHMLCTSFWKVNYRFAVDNVMDPMHGAYLHAESHSMAFGDKQAEMRARKTPTGFIFEKVGQQGVNFDWVEWGATGNYWMRLSIPYRKQYGPGGPFFIVGHATPVDANNTLVFFWRCRKAQGWQRDAWKFFYKNRLEGLHWDVLEQDRLVLENMAPNARGQEFLYQHDTGMTRVRRILEQEARAQAEALAAAEQPRAA